MEVSELLLGLFFLGLCVWFLSGLFNLFRWANEQGFIGFIAFVAAFVFFSPVMIAICIVVGFCKRPFILKGN